MFKKFTSRHFVIHPIDLIFCCILINKDGKITSTSAFPTVFTPGYDVTIAANDGHTTVGGKLWSIHVKGIPSN